MQERPLGEHRLRDGTRVRIRPLEPRDVPTVEDGLRGLAPATRRALRDAGVPVRELRRQLADADGGTLLGALRIDADGWECECLGIASCERRSAGLEIVEPVLVVFEGGRGLGRLLTEHLVRFAAARGVKGFRTVLADEHRWLRDRVVRAYPSAEITRVGARLVVDLALPPLAEPGQALQSRGPTPDPYWRLLRWVAEGTVQPRRRAWTHRWLGRQRWAWLRPASATP